MDAKSENKLSMYIAVSEVMTNNETKWAGVPRMGTAVTEHRGNIAMIKSLREIQEGNLKGITEDKAKRRVRMADLAMKIIGAMVAYAVDHDDDEMKRDIGYTRSQLVRGRDTTALSRCQKVYNKGARLAPALAEYGITPENISALLGAIAAYDLIIEKPRTAQAMETAALEEMEKVFRSADGLLKNRMDKLMIQFKKIVTAPGTPAAPAAPAAAAAADVPPVRADFYSQYVNAREIVDLGKHTFHFVDIKIDGGKEISVLRTVNGSRISNIGTALLTYRDSKGEETFELVPGDFADLIAPSGSIRVTNRDQKKTGIVRVQVYKK